MDDPKRLSHTGPEAALRRMQMSEDELIVLVEGTETDSFVVGSICGVAMEGAAVRLAVYPVVLFGPGGGKDVLVHFFDFLASAGRLRHTLQGKTTAAVFYLDKDVDDVLGTRRHSPHVVYTEHYDVQNYVYLHGDLEKGAASAASLPPQVLSSELSDGRAWCRGAAERWMEWVALCLFVQRRRIRYRNYASHSPLNDPSHSPTDPAAHQAELTRLRKASGLADQEFAEALGRTTALVGRYYRFAKQDRIFKGKWYSRILRDDLCRMASTSPLDKDGLEGRLTCAIAATLDFRAPWTEHLACPLRAMAALLAATRDA